MTYAVIFLGDKDISHAPLLLLIVPVIIWLDYVVLTKLIWPPKLEISLKGIRWENRALLERSISYAWDEFEGPEETLGEKGVSLLQIVEKSSGLILKLPPSHFGATYEEMAEIISAARNGELISPKNWRTTHPQHPFRRWLYDWGLPIAVAIILVMALRSI